METLQGMLGSSAPSRPPWETVPAASPTHIRVSSYASSIGMLEERRIWHVPSLFMKANFTLAPARSNAVHDRPATQDAPPCHSVAASIQQETFLSGLLLRPAELSLSAMRA
jgi:hypothetical protein